MPKTPSDVAAQIVGQVILWFADGITTQELRKKASGMIRDAIDAEVHPLRGALACIVVFSETSGTGPHAGLPDAEAAGILREEVKAIHEMAEAALAGKEFSV